MSDKKKYTINSILFITLIIIMLLVNIIKGDTKISMTERRKLALFPNINLNSLTSGEFSKNFEKYTMDQFMNRETFRKIKAIFEVKIFRKKDVNNVYEYNDYLIQHQYTLNENSVINATNKFNNIKNNYLSNDNNIYYTVIPDKNYFVSNGNLKLNYNNLVNIMNDNLIGFKYINIFDTLRLDDYYYTDTHWKQENLINTVNKISNDMNLSKKNINNYDKKQIADFYGVLSGQLKIGSKKDYINVLSNKYIDNATVLNIETNETTKVYNYDKLNGFDKYDVFLSGATPLLYINNDLVNTGKELVVFRDSFASSFIPLLIEDYNKITVIDIRYIGSSYLKDYVNFNNSDILFIYSTLVLNNSDTLK